MFSGRYIHLDPAKWGRQGQVAAEEDCHERDRFLALARIRYTVASPKPKGEFNRLIAKVFAR
jgi:hypothetical protein